MPNIFCYFCHIFLYFCHVFCLLTFFVTFVTFFAFDSTPRSRSTTTTTKLLLEPLSIARGQKSIEASASRTCISKNKVVPVRRIVVTSTNSSTTLLLCCFASWSKPTEETAEAASFKDCLLYFLSRHVEKYHSFCNVDDLKKNSPSNDIEYLCIFIFNCEKISNIFLITFLAFEIPPC